MTYLVERHAAGRWIPVTRHTSEVGALIDAMARQDAEPQVEHRVRPDRVPSIAPSPTEWFRPDGFTGPCPECGSATCPGFYKPDGSHCLAF